MHLCEQCVYVFSVINKHLRTHLNATEGTGFVYPASLLLRDRRDESASSGWNSSSSQWPTNCSASPNISFSLSHCQKQVHVLDSCHAKTGVSQNPTSIFPGIGVLVKSLFPDAKQKHLLHFYLQIDLIRIPVTVLKLIVYREYWSTDIGFSG